MKPLQHLVQIAIRNPKGGAEFLWRQPVTKHRRAGVLLGLELCIERGSLGRIRREHQDHPVHPEVRRNKSFVVLGENQRMPISGKRNGSPLVNPRVDAIGGVNRL